MEFRFAHNNISVLNLEKSLAFYQEALGLKEIRRKEKEDFILVFLGDDQTPHQLELTWMKERTAPYDLGDNEIHMAVRTADITAALKKHREMGCVCWENEAMGIYFIEDPDGYWTEILPEK